MSLRIILGSTIHPRLAYNFSTSSILMVKKWREERQLPENPNSFGPLTNLPDYSYLDGRPTPIGTNMKKRLEKQREMAKRIVTLCSELDFAKKRHAKLKDEKLQKEQKLLKEQLKPKGPLLLKK